MMTNDQVQELARATADELRSKMIFEPGAVVVVILASGSGWASSVRGEPYRVVYALQKAHEDAKKQEGWKSETVGRA